jgi:sodium/potassium-transporting ATPase subunit alpha
MESCITDIGITTQIGHIVQLTKDTSTVIVSTLDSRQLLCVSKTLTCFHRFIRIISSIAMFLEVTFFIISIATGKGAMSSLVFTIGIIVANLPKTVTNCHSCFNDG